MLPFLLSHLYGAPDYGESGLGLVLRENVLRFFQPFDNLGPIYTYLVYLPVYTLPWAPCWIIAVWVALRHWRQIVPNSRWLVQGLGLLMLFFTASGSRRSYYVLPLVPFAQLLGAWWITRRMAVREDTGRRLQAGFAVTAVLLLAVLGILVPWSNGGGGVIRFGEAVREQASRQAPWRNGSWSWSRWTTRCQCTSKRVVPLLLCGADRALPPQWQHRDVDGLAGAHQRQALGPAAHDHRRALPPWRDATPWLPGIRPPSGHHPAQPWRAVATHP